MNNFKLFVYTGYGKEYLDGSASEGYSLQAAIYLARENASAMPGKRIYIENGDTCKEVQSVINVNGRLSTELY